MDESPNKHLSKILMMVNMPLSIIGVGGMGMYIFLTFVSPSVTDRFGAIGSAIFTGLGLWLEYNYYKIAVRDVEMREEKRVWIISICYNTLILLVVIIAMVINYKDNWYYAFLLLIYPGLFGWFSVVALNKLRDFGETETEFDQQESTIPLIP